MKTKREGKIIKHWIIIAYLALSHTPNYRAVGGVCFYIRICTCPVVSALFALLPCERSLHGDGLRHVPGSSGYDYEGDFGLIGLADILELTHLPRVP